MTMKPKKIKTRSGVAIMDILILLVVLGVVGAITYPKFRTMLYHSREGRTKANLGDIRGAIAIYYSDHSGLFPSDNGTPESRLATALVPAYLEKLPPVDLTHFYPKKLNTVQDRLNNNGDWVYSTLNGFVYVNSTHMDTQAASISNW